MQRFHQYKDKGFTGLANIGNTCYLNSCMQILSHTYELNDFLNDKTYRNKMNKKPESLILHEWDELRTMMWNENCTIAPWRFVKAIQRISGIKNNPFFTGYQQNDIQEFLLFIIDCFHTSLSREVNMNISGKEKNKKDKLATICYKSMKQMYKKEYSEMINIFYGIQVNKFCNSNTNKNISQTPEPFSFLSLSIPNKQADIYGCLDEYCNKNNIEYTDKSGNAMEVYVQSSFWSLPNVLIIHLKRWNVNGRKNNALVTTPLTDLNLEKYVVGYNKKKYVYQLYGVCNHSGGAEGGHYTASIYNANERWYEINDTQIKEITCDNVITSSAYVLFYRIMPQGN